MARSMLSTLESEVRKWGRTFLISWSNQLVYKFDFLLQIIGPTFVFFFVKYSLWRSVYSFAEGVSIQGYQLQEMLGYQVWVLIVGFLAQGYNNFNLSEDIRMGRISTHIVYPFDFWKFQTAKFMASQTTQLFVALISVAIIAGGNWIAFSSWKQFASGILLSLLAGNLWFAICYGLGLAAFWLEETWMLRIIFMLISNFFSGALFPLDIFPHWLKQVLDYTPFPYLTYVPVRVFMGKWPGDIGQAMVAIMVWTGIAGFCSWIIWRRGMRHYAGAGM